MKNFTLGYREVIPDQTLPIKWKEIVLDTGCTQSTLQDIKATERAGCYSYNDCDKTITRNRFIYWRISQDTLELIELSLDLTIVNNHLRYKFTDTPLLDGLSIHETVDNVVILVATVSSVHRLSYSHPTRLYREGHHSLLVPSVFADATLSAAKNPSSFHIITRPNSTANSPLPNACTSWLASNGVAVFTLACSAGTILLIRLHSHTGHVELKQLNEAQSMMPRLFTNIAEALRGKQDIVTTVSMVMHNFTSDTFLFCLGSDANLRTWSTRNASKPMPMELLVNRPDRGNVIAGFQPHMLRKCEGPNGQLLLAVYLSFSTEAKFLILKPVLREAGSFEFIKHDEISGTEFLGQQWDLVDYCLGPDCLWALWRTMDGTPSVTSIGLSGPDPKWQHAIVEELPREPKNLSDCNMNPKHAYITEIFTPGKFPLAVITRALSIYQRSPHLLDHVIQSHQVLKDFVCEAVEADILKEIKEFDTTDDDFLEISHQHWAKFYSCCLQYYHHGDKPGGIAVLKNGNVLLIKKQRFSILRSMDLLEHFSLSEASDCLPCYLSTVIESRQQNDVITMLSMLRDLNGLLTEEQLNSFNTQQQAWQKHDAVTTSLEYELTHDPNDENVLDASFLESLKESARHMQDFYSTIELLLSNTFLSLHLPSEQQEEELPFQPRSGFSSMYASQLGSSVTAITLLQIVKQRLTMCRCLLVLEALVRPSLNSSSFSMQSVVVLAHAYYATYWACSQPANQNHLVQARPCIIAEVFIQQASTQTHRALAEKEVDSEDSNFLIEYISVIAGIIFPLGDNLTFSDFLFKANQLSALVGYESLLSAWCDDNLYSRLFLLGRVMLSFHQAPKACEYFINAAQGVTKEPYILLSLDSPDVSLDRAQTVYYLKIIEMFELHGYHQEVIEVTQSALNEISHDEPELPTFHSLLFTHSMGLGRYEDAYAAMCANPDEHRRKDCLREMIVVLVRVKQLSTLLEFPYLGFSGDVEKVLESRARASDMKDTTYYDVLYSFHVDKCSLRKAAGFMYEQAYRIENESSVTLESLQKQKGCYLTCLTSLRLVAAKYRWLVRPKQSCNLSNEELLQTEAEVKLMEISDIKKELELVNARIKLIKERPDEADNVTGKGWSASELVGVLTNAHLYCNASRLVKLFNLSADRLLEGLAAACVRLQRNPTTDAWDWLVHNNLADVSDGAMNATNTAWKLLEVLLNRHEVPGLTSLHKVIISRLLRDGFFPPQFLLASYKLRNPAELLRLYLRAGRLGEAAAMAVEYVNAVMGSGAEHYGGSAALMTGQPTCLPWQTLDQLIEELDRPKYEQAHQELKNLVIHFIETASRVSHQGGVGLVNTSILSV